MSTKIGGRLEILEEYPRSGSSLYYVQVEFEFRNVGFCFGRKTGVPGEKPFGAETRTKNKLNPHMTPRPGIEPGVGGILTALTLKGSQMTLNRIPVRLHRSFSVNLNSIFLS